MSPQIPIRILCVDDHTLVRDGIVAIINKQPDMTVIGEVGDATHAVDLFRHLRPDVTLMDLHLHDMSGIDATRIIRRVCPNARIIALTGYSSEAHLRGAIEAGASGYLLKESLRTELLNAIRTVSRGLRCIPPALANRLTEHQSYQSLTGRELEVLQLISTGARNRQIAEDLEISEETVKVHVKNILMKLAAEDRTQALAKAARVGLITLG
jgi:DNA-binding NarL/FixJ family response regulator